MEPSVSTSVRFAKIEWSANSYPAAAELPRYEACNEDYHIARRRSRRSMTTLRNRVQCEILRFRSAGPRPLGSTSVNVPIHIVGRPGLDPGTLGLKEGCGWSDPSGGVGIIRESKKSCPVGSDWSGDVGMVRGKKRGICERSQLLSVRVHVGPAV
jgi:hypothetical protein